MLRGGGGSGGGAGNVTGPGSSTDNAVARYNGTGGTTLQNSAVFIDDNGNVGIQSDPTPGYAGAAFLNIGGTLASLDGSLNIKTAGGATTVNFYSLTGGGGFVLQSEDSLSYFDVFVSDGVDMAWNYYGEDMVFVSEATDEALRLGVGGTVTVPTIKTTPVAVASLPAAATAGAGTRAFVTDANATTFASVVAGGGANNVPVYSDGTDWRIG